MHLRRLTLITTRWLLRSVSTESSSGLMGYFPISGISIKYPSKLHVPVLLSACPPYSVVTWCHSIILDLESSCGFNGYQSSVIPRVKGISSQAHSIQSISCTLWRSGASSMWPMEMELSPESKLIGGPACRSPIHFGGLAAHVGRAELAKCG